MSRSQNIIGQSAKLAETFHIEPAGWKNPSSSANLGQGKTLNLYADEPASNPKPSCFRFLLFSVVNTLQEQEQDNEMSKKLGHL